MANITLQLKVSVAWWVPLYLRTLALVCLTMGTQPDRDKIWRVIRRGISVRMER